MGLCPKRGEQDVGLSIFKGHTDVVCPKSWGTPFIRVYPLGYIIYTGSVGVGRSGECAMVLFAYLGGLMISVRYEN